MQSKGPLNPGHLLTKELNHPHHSGKSSKEHINLSQPNSVTKVAPFK